MPSIRTSVVIVEALAGALVGCVLLAFGQRSSSELSAPSVYTPAHESVLDAVKEFLNWRPAPVQPVAFTHKVHLSNGIQCEDCHAGVNKGPVAAIPSVKFCMTCHSVVATDRPEIKKVAAYFSQGQEIPWQRVYRFPHSAHVKFNHAPHIRAGVNCESCHGDLREQTVATRAVNLRMGYCLDCHKTKKVSIDCTTCHF